MRRFIEKILEASPERLEVLIRWEMTEAYQELFPRAHIGWKGYKAFEFEFLEEMDVVLGGIF